MSSLLTPTVGLVMGHVTWPPSSSGAASGVMQLTNPGDSGRVLRVRQFSIRCDNTAAELRCRRTIAPLTQSGTITNGIVRHLDLRNTSVIKGILKASTLTVEPAFARAVSFWFDLSFTTTSFGDNEAEQYFGGQVLRMGNPPLVLKPGSVLEAVFTGVVGSPSTVFLFWDEG